MNWRFRLYNWYFSFELIPIDKYRFLNFWNHDHSWTISVRYRVISVCFDEIIDNSTLTKKLGLGLNCLFVVVFHQLINICLKIYFLLCTIFLYFLFQVCKQVVKVVSKPVFRSFRQFVRHSNSQRQAERRADIIQQRWWILFVIDLAFCLFYLYFCFICICSLVTLFLLFFAGCCCCYCGHKDDGFDGLMTVAVAAVALTGWW